MDNKYYTPTIEEFHVGLEVEERNPDFQGQADGNEWKKMTCTKEYLGGDQGVFNNWKFFQDYRIKHLDKGDIESLGWKWKMATNPYCFHYTMREFYITHSFNPEAPRKLQTITIDIMIGEKHRQIFIGFIKNKSELSRLMKQLGIT